MMMMMMIIIIIIIIIPIRRAYIHPSTPNAVKFLDLTPTLSKTTMQFITAFRSYAANVKHMLLHP
jgi:hypothetical protein